MKHIDKILPLSILAINLILIINSIYGEFYILVFNHFLNSDYVIFMIHLLSIVILIGYVLIFFIRKVELNKRYIFSTILILVLCLFPINNVLHSYQLKATAKCYNQQYYWVDVNPIPEGNFYISEPRYFVATSALNNSLFVSLGNHFRSEDELLYIRRCIRDKGKDYISEIVY